MFTYSLPLFPLARLLVRSSVLGRLLALSMAALVLTYGEGASAQYTTLDHPDAVFRTEAYGINDRGQIVGSYLDANINFHGFVLSKGVYTTLDDLNGVVGTTSAQGINDQGQIVGYYADNTGVHSFLLSKGVYATLDDPDAVAAWGTLAYGINNQGQIVGYYGDNTGFHGFVLSKGVFTPLDAPNDVGGTYANGINDRGQIVGAYADNSTTDNGVHGFLLSP
jgi:uncharacterized membrane protein